MPTREPSGARATARFLTPAGRGAVAVIAVEGPGAAERCADRLGIAPPAVGELRLALLAGDAGELLDEALCVRTAEQRLELHLHGAPPLVRLVLARLSLPRWGPSLLAQPAGHAERARVLLGSAPSEAAARVLLDQAEGALDRALEALGGLPPEERAAAIAELRATATLARRLLVPPVVVFAGPVNTGKSTLFNACLGRERVVAHPRAGTTRDRIVERAQLGAYAVDLVDTAGERPVEGPVEEPGEEPGEGSAEGPAELERAGQALGRAARARADVVVWLDPGGAPPVDCAGAVVLASRADERPHPGGAGPPAISALRDPEGARAAVGAVVLSALSLPAEPWRPGAPVVFDEPGLSALAEIDPLATDP